MTADWEKLRERIREMHDLASAYALLQYDQASFMPPKGGEARAQAIGTLVRLHHERLIHPELGDLLDRLSEGNSLDQIQSASVRILTRQRDKATKVPASLVTALKESEIRGYQAWVTAKPASDFSILQPYMAETVKLKKEEADALGWQGERYDACLDHFEPGMTTHEVEQLFRDLIEGLHPLATSILDASGAPPDFRTLKYDADKQAEYCNALVDRLGFDREGGRLDYSPHPFTVEVAYGDVRQTIHLDENDLMDSLYASIHETGHALYGQGFPADMAGLPVADAPSMGMHESQSRLWENHVGRSRAFTEHMLPGLKEMFGEQLGSIDPDGFYKGINHAARSLVRIKADEVTYNFHVALRFELEVAMFRDQLDVADLPGAWNDAMERHLGVRPADDAHGVLQDMHWSDGYFGYFPTYTLGTLYAAAFFERMIQDLGEIDGDLRKGDCSKVLGWLREKVHAKAYLYPAKELARNILGEDVTAAPFLEHIRSKYGEIYSLSI